MIEEKLLKNIGKRIKELREERNLEQQDLGGKCNLNNSALSRIESGRINSTVSTLNKIAVALEVPLKELFSFKSEE